MSTPEHSAIEHREGSIHVDLASPADIDGIGIVHGETWLATYPNEEHGITHEDIRAKVESRRGTRDEHWRGIIEDRTNKKRIWVARDGQRVVGFCLSEKTNSEHTIQAIYILPGFQGKGIGKKLIASALEWFGSEKPVVLYVASYNHDAIAFYKKLGFEDAGKVPSAPSAKLPSGVIIPEIKMILPIPARAA